MDNYNVDEFMRRLKEIDAMKEKSQDKDKCNHRKRGAEMGNENVQPMPKSRDLNRVTNGIGGILRLVVALVIAYVGIQYFYEKVVGAAKERTVSDYRAETIRSFEQGLSKPDSRYRKRIEDAHLTVTVKSAEIVRCDVTTIDGSDKAGTDDSNIDRVSMLIRFNWQGIVDAGYTDIRYEYDVKNRRVLKSEIEYTTALVNAEDPSFWWGVGELLYLLL